MKKRVDRALAALFVAGVGACGGALESADSASIDSAFRRGDDAYLENVCGGQTSAHSQRDQKHACGQLERLRAPKIAAKAPCSDLARVYEQSPRQDEAFVALMARRMAECGQYEYLFERVANWGTKGEGAKFLVELEDQGNPLEAELVKYLASHQGPKFFPLIGQPSHDVAYGFGHIAKWLVERGHTQHCAEFADAAKGASAAARTEVLLLFGELKCKEGIPIAIEVLQDDEPNRREYACKILGTIGDASVAEKVKTIGDTDGYSTVEEEEREGRVVSTKSYPVREACLEAYGKIKLRN